MHSIIDRYHTLATETNEQKKLIELKTGPDGKIFGRYRQGVHILVSMKRIILPQWARSAFHVCILDCISNWPMGLWLNSMHGIRLDSRYLRIFNPSAFSTAQ